MTVRLLLLSAAASVALVGCASPATRFKPHFTPASPAQAEAAEACRREVLARFEGGSKTDNAEAAGTGAMLGGALFKEAIVFNPLVGIAMAPVALAAGAVAGVADSRRRGSRTNSQMNRAFAYCMAQTRPAEPAASASPAEGADQLRSLGVR